MERVPSWADLARNFRRLVWTWRLVAALDAGVALLFLMMGRWWTVAAVLFLGLAVVGVRRAWHCGDRAAHCESKAALEPRHG